VFTFGDAAYRGSAVGFNASSGGQAVGIIPLGAGYWIPNDLGLVDSVGAPAAPSPAAPVFRAALPPAGQPAGQLPAGVMPSQSVAPSTAFQQTCWVTPLNVSACNSAALADINAARAAEGYGPLPLASNFSTLGPQSQVLAVANAERSTRGLPALPENPSLDSLAQMGAQANGGQGTDPTGPAGYAWGSNIAWGDPTALAADFGWMYDDGPGSENIDCSYAGASGCWGHRKNILSGWGGQSGAGVYNHGGTMQLTELFVENYR
jgi:uncharacterized protein YkwD